MLFEPFPTKRELSEIERLKAENKRLKEKALEDSWKKNPDRSGGAFTQEEKDNASKW